MNEIDPAHRYFVDDRPDSSIVGTRLGNILGSLQQGRQLSTLALNYLQQQELAALQQFARGEVTYEAFCKIATAERDTRLRAGEIERLAREAARLVDDASYKAREAARAAEFEAARRARESDPKHIAKLESQRLRTRYGLDRFIEPPLFPRLMNILRRVDDGNRLDNRDVLWLMTEGRDCYSQILQRVFHEREADFFAAEYIRTSDPWNAVNASGHYRKCDQARKAHDLLTAIPPDRHTAPKLKSAIRTTHGGVMRDLGRLPAAMELGTEAHALTPRDFRPCTLLGAIHIESGHLAVGWEWYRKAEERGASKRSIDQDLRRIFARSDNARRQEIRAFLLLEDAARYMWVDDFRVGKS